MSGRVVPRISFRLKRTTDNGLVADETPTQRRSTMFKTRGAVRALTLAALVAGATLLAACSTSAEGAPPSGAADTSQSTSSAAAAGIGTPPVPGSESAAELCAGKQYTVGFSHPSSEALAVQVVEKYAAKRGTDLGCVKVLIDATTDLNLETQRAAIESWILQGVDAIVVRPVDPDALTRLQQDAQAKNIKWLTYTNHMDGQNGSVGWSTDNAGHLMADDLSAWLQKNYPNGGISAAVVGVSAQPTLSGQWDFPKDALNAAGIPIVLDSDCWTQECGLNLTETALQENPDLRVFIAGSTDDAGIGAAKAFENAGIDPSEVYIGGMDGSQQALEEIQRDSYYKATAAIKLDLLGYSIVDAAIHAIKDDGLSDMVTPNELATLADPDAVQGLVDVYTK
jgi:ABC-type sugar transport system substrate-binding protein